MLKNMIKRTLLMVLCVAMIIPALSNLTVFAAEDETSWEDMWNETVYPAYMSTEFSTIEDRLVARNNDAISPMTPQRYKPH